jgi:hypothetical protein
MVCRSAASPAGRSAGMRTGWWPMGRTRTPWASCSSTSSSRCMQLSGCVVRRGSCCAAAALEHSVDGWWPLVDAPLSSPARKEGVLAAQLVVLRSWCSFAPAYDWRCLARGRTIYRSCHLVLQGLLGRVLDQNKHVQEAACSALATLEEQAGPELLPRLRVGTHYCLLRQGFGVLKSLFGIHPCVACRMACQTTRGARTTRGAPSQPVMPPDVAGCVRCRASWRRWPGPRWRTAGAMCACCMTRCPRWRRQSAAVSGTDF